MSPLFAHVAPGDVISSQDMNSLLDKLDELEARIVDLEGGGGSGMSISHFTPLVEVPLGAILQIHGSGFGFPSATNSVTFDDVPIPTSAFLSGGSTQLIRIVVPTTLSVGTGGRPTTVRVRRGADFAEMDYRLLPEVPVAGDPPTITGVSDNPAVIDDPLTIDGTNFSTTLAENVVSFLVDLGSGPVAHSATVNTAAASQLEVTVPDVPGVTSFPPVPATIQITVGGHTPVEFPGPGDPIFQVQR